jgi:hypothetical protein
MADGFVPDSTNQGASANPSCVGASRRVSNGTMGKIRRSGYILEWFIGDHEPRHVHVYTSKRNLIGRLDVDHLVGVEGWIPDRKLIKLIADLKKEGRL